MSRLFDAYRAIHQQSFLPIFVKDDFDTKKLLDGCLEAGIKCIEYTLRRPDAAKMIPWIRENYPDLYLLVGSTLDDEKIVSQLKKQNPQLLTFSELDAIGVDGFVSMAGFSQASIAKYSATRILMPRAATATEALQQVARGAHFIKFIGPDLNLVKDCRAAPMHDYCPVMLTGGASLDRIPDIVDAGAVVLGAGFDLTLKGRDNNVSPKEIADVLRSYVATAQEAKFKRFPQLATAVNKDNQAWLNSLPHYHPF